MYLYYRKLLSFFAICAVLAISYIYFKESVHLWFCENENNGASCSIIGMIHEENKEYERAEKFLKKSCDLNYGIGCYRLSIFYNTNEALGKNEIQNKRKSKVILEKACQLEHEHSCLIIKNKQSK